MVSGPGRKRKRDRRISDAGNLISGALKISLTALILEAGKRLFEGNKKLFVYNKLPGIDATRRYDADTAYVSMKCWSKADQEYPFLSHTPKEAIISSAAYIIQHITTLNDYKHKTAVGLSGGENAEM